jgi:hypothetical protein
VHLSVENYPLAEALAVLVLDLQAAEWAFPLLDGGIGHFWGETPPLASRTFAYISFRKLLLLGVRKQNKSRVTTGHGG